MANWTTREISWKAPGAERVSILSRVSSISSRVRPTKELFSTVDSSWSWVSERVSGMRISLFFTTLLSVITTAIKAFSSTISRSYRFTVTRIRGAAAVKTG